MNILAGMTETDQPGLTVFSSKSGPLCKKFTLQADGTTHKETFATLSHEEMRHVHAPTPDALQDILDKLTSNQAVSIGSMRDGRKHAYLTTTSRPGPDTIARSKKNFHFLPDEAGWLLWDYDTKQMPGAVRGRIVELGGAWQALTTIWPELAQASYLLRPSSSDGVMGTRAEGLHRFVRMRTAGSIPATIKALHHLAWLSGLGWIMISASGVMLTRSIVDASVGSPERLIFEAPPILGEGVWRSPAPIRKQNGVSLNGLKLTDQQMAWARLAIETAKREAAPEAERVRAAYIEARVADLVSRTDMTQSAARKSILSMIDGAILSDDHMLEMADGSWVSVGAILDDDLDTWNSRGIPDPVEGLAYGGDKAVIYTKDRLRIISYAHGTRTTYLFARYVNPAPKTIDPYYPVTEMPRHEAIAAHGDTIRNWAADAFQRVRVVKAVKEVHATTEKETNERATAIGEIMGHNDLDHTPRPYFTQLDKAPKVMLTGAQGVGKTSDLLRVLVDNPDVCALVLLPDHGMAAEAADKYLAMGGTDPIVLRGRSAPRPDMKKATMCMIPEIADKVVRHGLSVSMTLCRTCLHKDGCAYQHQVRRMKTAKAIFAPHDWAWLPLPGGVKPDVMIFDERPRDFGVTDHKLPIELLLVPMHHDGDWKDRAEPMRLWNSYILPLMSAIHWAGKQYPWAILEALRCNTWTRDSILIAHDALDHFEPTMMINECKLWAGNKLEKVSEALDQPVRSLRELRALFKALAGEIDLGQPQATTVQVKEGEYRVTALKTLANCRRSPLLHLDGTGDHAMMQMLFGEMEHRHFPIERNATTTQVTGHTFSKSGITGEGRDGEWLERSEETAQQLREIIPSDAAVFSYKSAASALGMEDNPRFGHFNALRGSNQWEKYSSAFVIGRIQPSPRDVEHVAAPFAVAAGKLVTPGEYEKQWRGIRMADGTGHPIEVEVHPDPWAQRVLEQMREKELEQGLDRTRLIHNTEPKSIYLLTPLALDVTVDRVLTLKEMLEGGSRIERAVDTGRLVPLSGREAVRLYPSIWGNKDTANSDLDAVAVENTLRAKKLANLVYKDSIYQSSQLPLAQLLALQDVWYVRYRVDRPNAYAVEAHVLCSFMVLQEIIEARVGKIRELETIGHVG